MEQRNNTTTSSSSSTSSPVKNSISHGSLSIERLTLSSSSKDELLRRVFNYFDEDGDGKISPLELQKCVRTVGGEELSDEDAEMAVRSSDADGDGSLGLEDFTKLMGTGAEDERNEELKGAFEMYAMEGTGHITPKSLKRMLSKLGEKQSIGTCKVMIQKFDINGDGVLNFDEFKNMMT